MGAPKVTGDKSMSRQLAYLLGWHQFGWAPPSDDDDDDESMDGDGESSDGDSWL